MDPQQELFSALLVGLKDKGYDVYDGFLPPADTPYPFVYLADNTSNDDANKNAVFGTVYQTIHIWHNDPKKRGTVSSIALDIKKMCRCIKNTNSFSWEVSNINQRILPDTTTSTPLMHCVLEIDFKFS